MFGLSSIELAFCALLALLVIGPKELPAVARGIGHMAARARKMYQDVLGGVTRLEREIDIAENPDSGRPDWLDYLPDDIRKLKASIQPHGEDPEETAQKYRAVKQAIARAKQEHAHDHANQQSGVS